MPPVTCVGRFKIYFFLQELIKNYQLNETLIKSSKHIKLLVTPLKVRLSATDALVYKRFEVWVCLLKMLKEQAFEVLNAFLSFCFLSATQPQVPGKIAYQGFGKNCPLLWKEATEVLLEVIGKLMILT